MFPFTDEELKPAVENVLDKVRPAIVSDGGNVELIAIKNAKVYVQLQGACVGCASANTTLKFGIERQMKALIHPDIEVINVPKGFESELEKLG